MTSKELRKAFLDYFKKNGHEIIKSSPLLPQGDATMLFTTAGMVQFKPHFAGEVELAYTRATSAQKCLRTTDLDNVGKTPRHHTFFEMLGNFSFGDYFKKGAIEFGWDFSVNVVKLDKERIWVSVYEDDDEAFDIWNKEIGVPKEKIVRLGKKDNFWGPAGETGACGPCSEMYYDLGADMSCGDADCKPGCDCNRYIEYWNLVFNQFNYTKEGKFEPLPMTGIDTGMGLERLCLVSQDVKSVYETDLFAPFIKKLEEMSGRKYEDANKSAFNVIADHIRAVTFALNESILPSNEGRGYVIRRILRRAIRFGKTIGIEKPFMYRLVDVINEIMAEQYPELLKSADNAKKVIKSEEERFFQTLNSGVNYINSLVFELKKEGKKVISGDEAFKLYDTMGFPLDLSQEIADEAGLEVDEKRFSELMEEQRERGRQQWKAESSKISEVIKDVPQTEYVGDEEYSYKSKVILILDSDAAKKDEALIYSDVMIVLDKTPFYAESGGQVGDEGQIKSSSGIADVIDTKKSDERFYHICRIKEGSIKTGDTVTASVDKERKMQIARNHSVTHLAQSALKKVLGDHVRQLGSLVEYERMRFDFSHFSSMSDKEIKEVEDIVNDYILSNAGVTIRYLKKSDAEKTGAIAFFGEKYSDVVRVVTMGDYSSEFCGGTHVKRTGDIGMFKILSESSISSGTRRLECVTGKSALLYVNKLSDNLKKIEESINAKGDDVALRIEGLVSKVKELEKEIKKLKTLKTSDIKEDIENNQIKAGSFSVAFIEADIDDAKDLRMFSDRIKNALPSYIAVVYHIAGDKIQYLVCVSSDNAAKGVVAGDIVKEINKVTSGRGGGKDVMAQGGGNAPSDISEIKTAIAGYFSNK
jgi:alanyl-tRNA synthetase